MKSIDDLILNATPENLKKFQELDMATQLDGRSFYDIFVESKVAALLNTQSKPE